MFLGLMLPLWLSVCAPLEGEQAAAPAELKAEPTRLVFTADLGVTTIAFFPRAASGDLSVFAGASLPGGRRRRPTHWTAIGLRLIGSYGTVLLNSNLDRFIYGLRPHLTVIGAAGRRGRLTYSAGLGPVFGFRFDETDRAHPHEASSPYGMEIGGRIGYLIQDDVTARVRVTFGGMLSMQVGGGHSFPMPFVGLYLGMALVPR